MGSNLDIVSDELDAIEVVVNIGDIRRKPDNKSKDETVSVFAEDVEAEGAVVCGGMPELESGGGTIAGYRKRHDFEL